MKYNFIVIEGIIGAGKTSLATKIADQYGGKLILEQFSENPFLPKFYNDPERYSFPLELSFLAERYHQLQKDIENRDLFKNFTVADYYFAKSLIFANNTLPGDELKLYRKLFDIIYNYLPIPDLYVYLHLNVENAIKNIQKRGRSYEQQIKPDYLHKLQESYFSYFKQEKDFRFLVIDTNGIDFVNNQQDYNKLLDVILNNQYNKGINRICL